MQKKSKLFFIAALFLFIFSNVHSLTVKKNYYSAYNRILKRYVNSRGDVNYKALKQNKRVLSTAIRQLKFYYKRYFKGWRRNRRIAYWINLYNLFTISIIVDNYPVKSIKNINRAFDNEKIKVGGRYLSLNHIENKILRVKYSEPRIHFALVCAAKSCPLLRREPYTGARLNYQLAIQSRRFLARSKHYRINKRQRIVYLSSIFKWFGKDFKKFRTKRFSNTKKGIFYFLRVYAPGNKKPSKNVNYKIKFIRYDWTLNDWKK